MSSKKLQSDEFERLMHHWQRDYLGTHRFYSVRGAKPVHCENCNGLIKFQYGPAPKMICAKCSGVGRVKVVEPVEPTENELGEIAP